jgi:hypothetical protein
MFSVCVTHRIYLILFDFVTLIIPESLDLWTLAIVRNYKSLENITLTFRKLDLFSSLGEARETPTVLGPLEGANQIQ